MILAYTAIGVLGAVFASFVGVLVDRVNTGESWVTDRSRCDSCRATLTARDLVPVVSWLLSRGTCRHCGSRVPARHVLVEFATAGVFFAASAMLGITPTLSVFLMAVLVLLFIVLYDVRHTIVPTVPVLALVTLGVLFAALTASSIPALGLTLMTAGAIAFVFLLFYVLSGGRAMGLGDTPVALALSLLVGYSAALPGLLFSFWIGALYGIVVLVSTPRGHRMGIEVPFVPFLALGFLLAFFTGWNPLPLF